MEHLKFILFSVHSPQFLVEYIEVLIWLMLD